MNVLIVALLVSALIGYTGHVTALVVGNAALERHQKVLQVAMAWLVPFVGAIIVHVINRAQEQGPAMPGALGPAPQTDQGVSPRDFEHPGHG